MKKIIFLSLLIIIFSIKTEIEFGKEISFDKDNNEYEFVFQENGVLFVLVTFGTNDILHLKISFYNLYNNDISVSPPGKGWIIPFKKDITTKIKLEYTSPSNEKGTIWIFPSTKEIKVNLNQIYEWKYDFSTNWNNRNYEYDAARLIYSIDKAEKDALLEFKYNDKLVACDGKLIPNPIKINHGETSENNIINYEIKKGESYKIYINLYSVICVPNKLTGFAFTYYYLPSFEFHFIYDEEQIEEEEKKEQEKEKIKQNEKVSESKNYTLIFIILGILLILGIIISILLICRKNKKGNISNENFGFELNNIEDEY